MVRDNVIFAPKAENDLVAISDWYLWQGVDLDKLFIGEVEKGVKRIERNPESFRFISRDVRRMRLKKFPYYMYFSFLNGITILRIRHTKQQPLKRFT